MAAALRCVFSGLFIFLAFFLRSSCVTPDLNMTDLSRAILSMVNDTLGVGEMQKYFAGLTYKQSSKSTSAQMVAVDISNLFDVQQRALRSIKERVEQVYYNGDYHSQEEATQCCNVTDLTDDFVFGLPISEVQSCDRISGIASPNAPSLYGQLDNAFQSNHMLPLKWQYFGSEMGILNQFPSSRPSDCSSYDNRFRPWYKASATPNPKDVVIVIKNNPYPDASRLFEAADIIFRTLNPRDRVALVIYNDDIRNMVGGCYATNLSLATPANVHLFQNLLKTAPDARDGERMSLALEAAYKYYDFDLDIPVDESMMTMNLTEDDDDGSHLTEHDDGSHLNITTRDRAIVFLTDGKRISEEEETKTKKILEKYCYRLRMVSIFILYSTEVTPTNEVLAFYRGIVTGVPGADVGNLIEISNDDLRLSLTNFYKKFASEAQHSSEFKPVYIVPYYDVFGLEQLVMTLSTPCYQKPQNLLGVASVDLKVSDMFSNAEYFTQGDVSYAFVIDQDGLVLIHPLLPLPSTTSAAIYLDISTLEPQPGFTEIRQSMISGGSGSKELESYVVLSRTPSMQRTMHRMSILSNYSWAPIAGTPYSLCVVVPKDSFDCNYATGLFEPPINAHYHMLDVLVDRAGLCRQVAQYATPIVLFPEAFTHYSLKHGEELKNQSKEIQHFLTSFNDENSYFKVGVMETVAATAKAEEIWLNLDSNHDDGNSTHDYVAWRYIASSNGVMRIYPGTQVDISGRRANRYPWYQNAVSDVESVTITPPRDFGTVHTISISKAIIKTCGLPHAVNATELNSLRCGIEAVMGMDIAYGHFWTLLNDNVKMCRSPEKYRCMLIDSNAYVITHPRFFNAPHTVTSHHLSAIEPFLMRDMYHTGYVDRVYCNNFQYNAEFTKRPRKQFSYIVSDKVKKVNGSLEGGYMTRCVFYSIAPVAGTNAFFIVVDVERSLRPLCTPISCPCDPDQPCSNIPSECACPCVEELPPENYNSCLESFTQLNAHACTPETGFMFHSTSHLTMSANSTVKACYPQNCSEIVTPLDCLSNIACINLLESLQEDGSLDLECRHISSPSPTTINMLTTTSPITEPSPTATMTTDDSEMGTEETLENQALSFIWQGISGILLVLLILTLFCFFMYVLMDKRKPRRGGGRRHGRVTTSSTNMVSVATDSSAENSLRRQSSQDQSCSSQEGLPAAVQKLNGTVSSYITSGSIFTTQTVENAENTLSTKDARVLISVGEEPVETDTATKDQRGEGEGMCVEDTNSPLRSEDPFDTDQKTSSSFPDSLGTNGLHDMISGLGESPDPSKAGGIWF